MQPPKYIPLDIYQETLEQGTANLTVERMKRVDLYAVAVMLLELFFDTPKFDARGALRTLDDNTVEIPELRNDTPSVKEPEQLKGLV